MDLNVTLASATTMPPNSAFATRKAIGHVVNPHAPGVSGNPLSSTEVVCPAECVTPTDEGDEGTLGEVGGVSNAGAGNTPLADVTSMACHGLLIDGE